MQTGEDGTQSEINDATTAAYTLSKRDIGFQISVLCEPVRSDWARGPTVLSETIGPILPGILLMPKCELYGLPMLKEKKAMDAFGSFIF